MSLCKSDEHQLAEVCTCQQPRTTGTISPCMCATTHHGTFPSCNMFHVTLLRITYSLHLREPHGSTCCTLTSICLSERLRSERLKTSRMQYNDPSSTEILRMQKTILLVGSKVMPNSDDLTPLLKSPWENSSKKYHVDNKQHALPRAKNGYSSIFSCRSTFQYSPKNKSFSDSLSTTSFSFCCSKL